MRRFRFSLKLFLVLVVFLIGSIIVFCEINTLTNSRYIKKETDEIRGYYTSLYFDVSGENNCIVLEKNIGYTNIELRNYIGEDVTKRDIEYNIHTIDTFYNINGDIINDPKNQDLYVKDVWGNPQPIKGDTYKYEVNVENNTGEVGDVGDYLFSYQEINNQPIGKQHSTTLKIMRNSSETMNNVEYISIVVELVKPYKEVFIVNMVVVNRLIAFTNLEKEQFLTPFESLNIQTADIFTRELQTSEHITISSYAFLVTLNWENLILDLRDLSILHNVVPLEEIKQADNIDLSKPYIIEVEENSLKLYIPQSSNLNIDFFPTNDVYQCLAKVEIMGVENYVLYNSLYGGYTEEELNNDYIYCLGNDKSKLVH